VGGRPRDLDRRGGLTTNAATPRMTRRLDLMAVDDVPEGTMKMAWVDGADQVVVVQANGVIRAFQGICTHEYFELDKGFLTNGTLTCALHQQSYAEWAITARRVAARISKRQFVG